MIHGSALGVRTKKSLRNLGFKEVDMGKKKSKALPQLNLQQEEARQFYPGYSRSDSSPR